MRASSTLKLSVATLVLLAACGDSSSTSDSIALKPKITIGSTTDPTSQMIAEIYGQALEKAEFRVARRLPFATSAELLTAMTKGEVQLSGITSQGLFKLLQNPSAATTPEVPNTITDQVTAMKPLMPPNVAMGAPTTAEDKDVVFCAKTFTDTNTIATLTDLGTKPGIATLAAPAGFDAATPLGSNGLKSVYSIEFKSIVPTDAGKSLAAVNGGTADCGVGRSADPALAAATLTVLQDDKALVPNDVILPIITSDSAGDDVLAILDQTSTKLTTDALRDLMSRLVIDKASPEIVANEFIGNAGQ